MASGGMGRLIGRTLGDYTLTALVGIGGMAEVYRAQDRTLGREVAVKVLSPEGAGDANYRDLFRKEARRVAALDHPNIVPVYYLGEQDGLLFLVMPLMAESLRQRIERAGRPSPYESVRLIVQIAAALYVAHTHGIIHRDVKPENIMLNAEGRPLLTDFGIARDANSTREQLSNPNDPLSAPRPSQTLARPGLPVGTPEYMAPEQLRMVSVDSRVDIYALGAVLYELLTDRPPHEAPTPEEVAALTLSAPVVPPSHYNRVIWPELEVAVLTALAYEPGDRYPDAQRFATALLAAVDSHPEQAMGRITPPSFEAGAAVASASVAGGQARLSRPSAIDLEPTVRLAAAKQEKGRKRLLLIALVVLIVAGVVAGSGFLFFGNTSTALGTTSATQTASATGSNQTLGVTGTSGTVVPVTTGTPRSVHTIPGPPKAILKNPPPPITTPAPTATATATTAPTATDTATTAATGTPAATNTPSPTAPPTATSTPAPPPLLTLNPSGTLQLTNSGSCWWSDAQTVYNPGTQARSWSWSISTSSSDTLEWSPDGSTWYDAAINPPMDPSMAGGTADYIYVAVDLTARDGNGTPTGGCVSGDTSTWTITFTDDLSRSQTFGAELD